MLSVFVSNGQTVENGWHLKGLEKDSVYGIDLYRAMEYLKGRKSQKVRVAVLDSGVATDHENLMPVLWVNKGEIAGDGIDNDGNGYIDDVNGWNFLVRSDGTNLNNVGVEYDREFFRLLNKFENVDSTKLNRKERAEYRYFKDKVCKNSSLGGYYLRMDALNERERKSYLSLLDIMKKNLLVREEGIKTANGKKYGNPHINSRNLSHGTHVAGIIGGTPAPNFRGVCDNVEIICVRVVPDGDEFDLDVANGIRYAVDNGAEIINMSFGKYIGSDPKLVQDAIRYGVKKGVLFMSAAGNDGLNIDDLFFLPRPKPSKNVDKRAENFLIIGSNDMYGAPAYSSCWGKNSVDLFAPGVGIYSTYRKGEFMVMNGTSMATPVVTGVAALLKSYFPELTAKQICSILLQSSSKYPGRIVPYPNKMKNKGYPKEGLFSDLSRSGGIVNAYEAVKMADELSKNKLK